MWGGASGGGLKLARGAVIAITNDDCLLAVDWLTQSAKEFTCSSDVVVVFGPFLPSCLSRGMLAVAALVLIVLGLVAGQATVGSVAIGGDRNPLMASEDMVLVTENMPLMPPQLTEDAGFVEDLREVVRERYIRTVADWLFLMFQWWMPTCLIGTIFVFAELIPRLLVFHLIALVVLWAVMAAAAWGVWLIIEKLSAEWLLKMVYVAASGGVLTAMTVAGHWLLSAFQ